MKDVKGMKVKDQDQKHVSRRARKERRLKKQDQGLITMKDVKNMKVKDQELLIHFHHS